MYKKSYSRRFWIVVGLFLFVFGLIIIRLFFIQFFRSGYLKGLAARQHNTTFQLNPKRGIIYDINLRPLAINLPVESLYAVPPKIKDREFAIEQLSEILNLDKFFLQNRIYRDKSFVWIARKLASQTVSLIKSLHLQGLEFIKETKRSYPNGSLASHIIGYAGLDNIGLEGIELSYDSYLRGKNGWCQILRDAKRKTVLLQDLINPIDGYDVVLTIDEVIQYIAERHLDDVFKRYNAKAATIIIMQPQTGKILALANQPNFNLNTTSKSLSSIRRNRAICDLFEPGSVFKIVTAAGSLEENLFKEEDTFFCENGSYRIANHILHDNRPHGWLTFKEVIQQSSNIGVAKIARELGPDRLYKYIKKFGFGSKLGIDLPGEICGIVRHPSHWSKTSMAAIPMGQEIAVTALQLVSAISAIANGGLLMRPYLVDRIQDKNKETIKQFQPKIINRVISNKTADRMTKILTAVVDSGTGRMAKIEGIKVAGKTGTAQKVEKGGGYSHNKFIASFIGFAPAVNPEISVVVVVDEPRPYYFGGVVSAPVFKKVVLEVLSYLKRRDIEDKSRYYEAKRVVR